MLEVKLSTKNQIVLPREARNALSVQAGEKLLVVVRGGIVILLRKPQEYSSALRGIGKGIYPSDYLEKERSSWQ
ncbi:MAG: AbrB/MazE/SpoVT family DNA-binding domain-containing protein [Armatimonadetes bacterium]|nr:AbrB/MazE/SpoVT family DNA-binding domain-containing protein [Armatimonadota bacterium]